MTLVLTGLLLLAAAAVTGSGYYHGSKPSAAIAASILGTVCISVSQVTRRMQTAHDTSLVNLAEAVRFQTLSASALCLVALLPTVLFFPWQYKLGGALMMAGLVFAWPSSLAKGSRQAHLPSGGQLTASASDFAQGLTSETEPVKRVHPDDIRIVIGQALFVAGVFYWTQVLALLVYKTWTSYSHELPWPLPDLLAVLLRIVGAETGVENSTIMLFTMREVHQLGATWELLIDPITFCFLTSGAVALLLLQFQGLQNGFPEESGQRARRPKPTRQKTPAKSSITKSQNESARPWFDLFVPWAIAAVLWLPVRVVLLVGLFLNRALRTEYDEPLDLMWFFWNEWVLAGFALPLVWMQARWIRPQNTTSNASTQTSTASVASLSWHTPAFIAASVVCMTLAVLWDPIGHRKQGRVVVDEYHSKWEPTDKPFDTNYYGHLSGYNYACIYDYCSRFYSMSRLTNAINEASLSNVDVFVAKVPTEPYLPSEIELLLRFVERGGGLLLIGEHTDVFSTGYNLNTIARKLGFEFRYDCLFGIDSFFDQYYRPPFVPHPVVQNVRGMDFATSCSIRPIQFWRGRSVITSTGLKNSMADYHASNFYPQAVDHAAMRYGAFVQLWSVRLGRGRVLAFTDSTIFSNFCTFEPGKSELMLGMLEYLNRKDNLGNPRIPLLLLGGVMLGTGIKRLKNGQTSFAIALCSAVGAWSIVCLGLKLYQKCRFPLPPNEHPYVQVTIDRTACSCPLSKNGFIEGKNNGFGIFERWILRLGYFTRRATGSDALKGDLVVFLFPDKAVDAVFVKELRSYVENGGRVLVIDSAQNTNSTAAAILEPFGLAQLRHPEPSGVVDPPHGFPAIRVEFANETRGGTPIVSLNNRPVATIIRAGRGSVALIGFGSRFTDLHMGVTGDVVPDTELRKVYDFQFALIRGLVERTLMTQPGQTGDR